MASRGYHDILHRGKTALDGGSAGGMGGVLLEGVWALRGTGPIVPAGLRSMLSWSTEFVAGHFQHLTGKFK